MNDKPQMTEAVKRELEDTKRRKEAIVAEQQKRAESTPTPTQEENDQAALGVHVTEKEDDGSGPDPNSPAGLEAHHKRMAEHHKAAADHQRKQGKQSEAQGTAAPYRTREATPAARATPHTGSRSE